MNNAGKGSRYRPVDRQKWDEGWDRVFGPRTLVERMRQAYADMTYEPPESEEDCRRAVEFFLRNNSPEVIAELERIADEPH